jgi:hypothetical protein
MGVFVFDVLAGVSSVGAMLGVVAAPRGVFHGLRFHSRVLSEGTFQDYAPAETGDDSLKMWRSTKTLWLDRKERQAETNWLRWGVILSLHDPTSKST